jgi:hypothetical protein
MVEVAHVDGTSTVEHPIKNNVSKQGKNHKLQNGGSSSPSSTPIACGPGVYATPPASEEMHPSGSGIVLSTALDPGNKKQERAHMPAPTTHSFGGGDDVFEDESAALLVPTTRSGFAMSAAATGTVHSLSNSSDNPLQQSLQSVPHPSAPQSGRQPKTTSKLAGKTVHPSSHLEREQNPAPPTPSAVVADPTNTPIALGGGKELRSSQNDGSFQQSHAISTKRDSSIECTSASQTGSARPRTDLTVGTRSLNATDSDRFYDASSEKSTCGEVLEPSESRPKDKPDGSPEREACVTPRSPPPRLPLVVQDVEDWKVAASQGLHGSSSKTSVCFLR